MSLFILLCLVTIIFLLTADICWGPIYKFPVFPNAALATFYFNLSIWSAYEAYVHAPFTFIMK